MIEIDLRPFERKDFSRLIEWIKSPEFLLQWAGPIFRFPLDEPQLERYLEKSHGDQPPRRIAKAVNIDTNEVIGHIELDDIDWHNKSARLCRVLVGESSFRGRGVGVQMAKKLLEVGFNELGLHRVELVVFDFNEAAIRCYERVGFVKEGRLRDARKFGSEYWSLYQMSILEHEWRPSAI
jgi:RimJ/RimL family protein N-acetyltransferase